MCKDCKNIAVLLWSVVFLVFSNNRITTDGALCIAKGLEGNNTLEILKVRLNKLSVQPWPNDQLLPIAYYTYLESSQLSFGLSGNYFSASYEASEFC